MRWKIWKKERAKNYAIEKVSHKRSSFLDSYYLRLFPIGSGAQRRKLKNRGIPAAPLGRASLMKFEMNERLILIIGGLKVNRARQINCKSGFERRALRTLNRVMRTRRVQPDKKVNKFVFASITKWKMGFACQHRGQVRKKRKK